MPSESQIMAQSKAAYGQWAVQWREHATWHSKYKMKSLIDFENIGIGKAVLCIANGYSFEENLATIQELQGNVDIICCDKTLGHCIDNGIKPTYCLVADANVNYEKYLDPWKDKVDDIILFISVCGNPQWTEGIKWKDKYFYTNKDIIKSEVEFAKLSGCPNCIPAATNVSNAMIVFLTQSDDRGRNNLFGYDKILTIGFDYSWRPDGKYYAFDETGNGKANYMRHIYCTTNNGTLAYTSGNLAFSAEWLTKYVKAFKLPVVQCSRESVFAGFHTGDLRENLNYSFRPQDGKLVREMIMRKNALVAEANKIQRELHKIGRDHYYAYASSI